MADETKKVLLQIDSNLDEYRKEAAEAGKSVRDLQDEIKELKKAGGDNTEEIERANEQLRNARKQYRESTKAVDDLSRANKAQAGSYEQLQAQVRIAEKGLKQQEGLLIRNADGTIELSDSYITASKELENARGALNTFNQGINQGNTNVGLYTQSITKAFEGTQLFGPAVSGITNGIKGLSGAAKASILPMISLKAAMMALPFMFIIGAITSLIQYFKRSEEGQNSWNKIMAVAGHIMNRLMDVFANAGKVIVDAVNKPREAWENFKDTIQAFGEFFKNTFGNVIMGSIEMLIGNFQKMYNSIGLGWQKLKGIFVDNTEGIAEAEEKLAKAEAKIEAGHERRTEGVQNLVEGYRSVVRAIKDEINVMTESAKVAAQIADSKAKLDRMERDNLVKNEQLRDQFAKKSAEAEELKKRDAEASIKLLEEAYEIDKQRIANEMELSQMRVDNKRLENSLTLSTKEDLRELAELEAAHARLKSEIATQERARITQLEALKGEAFNQANQRRAAELESEKIKNEAIIQENQRILDSEMNLDQSMLHTYEQREEAAREIAARRAELIAKETELEIQQIRNRLDLRLISEQDARTQLELIHARSNSNILEIDREYNEAVKGLGDERMVYQQMVFDETIKGARMLLNSLQSLSAEGSAMNKAFAVADAIVNTYLGVTKALASSPPPASYITAAATFAQGMAAVKKIMAAKKGSAGSASGSMQSSPVRRGYVASRADGMATTSSQNIAGISQNIQGNQTVERVTEKHSIQKVVLSIEEFDRVRDNKKNVEYNAGY